MIKKSGELSEILEVLDVLYYPFINAYSSRMGHLEASGQNRNPGEPLTGFCQQLHRLFGSMVEAWMKASYRDGNLTKVLLLKAVYEVFQDEYEQYWQEVKEPVLPAQDYYDIFREKVLHLYILNSRHMEPIDWA